MSLAEEYEVIAYRYKAERDELAALLRKAAPMLDMAWPDQADLHRVITAALAELEKKS